MPVNTLDSPPDNIEAATVCVQHAGADGSLDILWSTRGHAFQRHLAPANGKWTLDKPLLLYSDYYGFTTSTMQSATISFPDVNGARDIQVDAHWTKHYYQLDQEYTNPGEKVVVGHVDATAPDARSAYPDKFLYPIDGFVFATSEAMRHDTMATLHLGTTDIAMTPDVEAGYVVGATASALPPFATPWSVTLTGTDIAGIGTPASVHGVTPSDPGVLVQDGFESGSTAGILGDTAIVDSAGGGSFPVVPALDGKLMLQVNESALLHLQRTGAETVLRVRTHWQFNGIGTHVWLKVGVIGDSGVSTVEDPGDGDVTLALPGPGKDVLLSVVATPDELFNGILVLLDDVRLE